MKIIKFVLAIIWLFFLIVRGDDVVVDGNSILFRERPKEATCQMFQPECDLDILVVKQIPVDDLIVGTTDSTIFTIRSIENCVSACNMDQFAYLDRTKLLDTHVYYRVKIVPHLIGAANVTFVRTSTGGHLIASYMFVVAQPRRIIDRIFDVWIWVFGCFISCMMGVLIDRESLVKIIKMPKAVIAGFCCQYFFMPLLAFGVARLFRLTPIEALAVFIYGCSPGGTASNNWTILLNGDLDLSAILTFVSTCSSIIMMPTWVYTLGRVFSREADITIPLTGLLANLFITIGPCLFGLIMCYFFPKLRTIALRIVKPLILVALISFLILLLFTKWYTFRLVRLRHWISGPLIPYFGYILGGSAAFILRLPFRQIKTVALETGIQNVGVAFLIIFTNLPSPQADYAAFPIVAISFMTPMPLYVIYLVMRCVTCVRKRRRGNKDEADQKEQKNGAEDTNKNTLADATTGPEETPMIEKTV